MRGLIEMNFLKELKRVTSENSAQFEMIHKKINLAEQMLAWEHERFSMRRIPAFTISSLSVSIRRFDKLNYK
mgnify:CR=1 FL=1